MVAKLNGQELIYLADLRFIQASGRPAARLQLTIALLSLSGLPPLAGFFGKLSILSVLLDQIYISNDLGSYVIFLVFLGVTLIMSFYYFRLVKLLFTDITSQERNQTLVSLTETRIQLIIRTVIFIAICSNAFWITSFSAFELMLISPGI